MRILALIIALMFAHPAWAVEHDTPAPEAAAAPAPVRPMLSQGDPAWRNIPYIGNITIGRSGCLLVALLDIAIDFGLSINNPVEFARFLARNGLFTLTGLLYWDLERALPFQAERITLSGNAAYAEAVRHLNNGSRVLLQLVTSRGTRHWVVASRVMNGDLEIRDPNGGRIGMLGTMYGRQSLRGLAIVTRR